MTEVVWVALISAGTALVTALLTQILSTRAASKQADRTTQREALQWQRTEALRQEELERKEAQRLQDLQDVRLRELWGHVLTVRWQVHDALETVPVKGRPAAKSAGVSAATLPAHAAGQAYSVALIGLAALRPSAKAFYVATSKVQFALLSADEEALNASTDEWNKAYKAIESSVASLADGCLSVAAPAAL